MADSNYSILVFVHTALKDTFSMIAVKSSGVEYEKLETPQAIDDGYLQ